MIQSFKQSQTIRMLLVAGVGVVLGFVTYEIVYVLNPFSPKATVSWTIAFVIGIARQHALHRKFPSRIKHHILKACTALMW
jgi:putative flippase GtrA